MRYSNLRELQTTAPPRRSWPAAWYYGTGTGLWPFLLAYCQRSIHACQSLRQPLQRPERGAWYAAFTRQTSELEVASNKSKELQEIRWQEKEIFAT